MAFKNRVLMLLNGGIFLQIGGAGGVLGSRKSVGVAEQIPDILFIAKPEGDDNGFIGSAQNFHKTYGFVNHEVESIEAILEELVKSTKPIGCMRIVSHAFIDYISLKLFKGSSLGTRTSLLAGFAKSDVEGLKAILVESTKGHIIPLLAPNTPPNALSNVLFHLRSNDVTKQLIVPFGLDDSSASVVDPALTYLRFCMDFMSLNPLQSGTDEVEVWKENGDTNPITAAQRKAMQDAFKLIIDDLAPTLVQGTVTTDDVQKLQTELLHLTRTELIVAGTFSVAEQAVKDIGEAMRAIKVTNIRDKINTCRKRFNRNSRIDIRGCALAKKNRDGLKAVQAFFGQPGNLPAVTGPDWYQGFPAGIKPVNPVAAAKLFTDGFTQPFAEVKPPGALPYPVTFSVDDVKDALSLWSGLTNFDALFTFFTQQFGQSPFDFTSFPWESKQTVPGGPTIPVLNMDAKQIDALATLKFDKIVLQFRTIFNLSTVVPSKANRTKIGQFQPLTLELLKVEAASATASPDQDALLTQLKALYTKIKDIAVTGVNPPATPIVPADAQADKVQQYATDLHGHLDTVLGKLYETFFTDIKAAMALPQAALLVYLRIGLPLLVENRKRPPNPDPLALPVTYYPSNSIILLDDVLQNESLRSFLKTLWTGTTDQVTKVNGMIGAVKTSNRKQLNRPILTEGYLLGESNELNDRSDAAFAPLVEYSNHIIVEPASP